MLDAIARAPLWAEGIDFGHGTGDGVGYFLNVHEGPQAISQSAMPEPHTAMEPGMITSIEPGIYRPGRWGIRLENLSLPKEEHEHGGCDKPDCGRESGGGCSTCSTGGGCSTCGSGKTDLREYFGHLRTKMESRIPLA